MAKNAKPGAEAVASTSNFIRSHIDADLAAGKYYVNIHTAANKGGEIRGQILAR